MLIDFPMPRLKGPIKRQNNRRSQVARRRIQEQAEMNDAMDGTPDPYSEDCPTNAFDTDYSFGGGED